MTDVAPGLPLGVRSRSVGRTLTAAELDLMASLTTAWHSDSDGQAVAVEGPIVATLVATLATNTAPLHQELRAVRGLRTVAAMGIEAVVGADVYAGDTLWADTWVESIRPSSSKPDHYVLTICDEGINQRGEVVVELRRVVLVEKTI